MEFSTIEKLLEHGISGLLAVLLTVHFVLARRDRQAQAESWQVMLTKQAAAWQAMLEGQQERFIRLVESSVAQKNKPHEDETNSTN